MTALAKNIHIYIELAVDRYAPLCERGTADMQLAVDRYAPLCERGTAECAMTRV